MKTRYSLFFSALLVVAVLGFSACQCNKSTQVLNEQESMYDLNQTVELIQSIAKEKGWTVPIVHDMQANMEKAGITVLPAKIIELCHGKYASEILLSDTDRNNLALLPCRVAVYEKEDGKTYVSWMNFEQFSKSEHGKSLPVFATATQGMQMILDEVVK
jgi:uncharacterized protein (DUF302 family)